MHNISLKPIGYVSSSVTRRRDKDWGDIESRIVLEPEYSGALLGLENFSHAIIVTYLHESVYEKEKHLQRRPRNLEAMPLTGIFSQRGKNRPNPVGVTAVRIIQVMGDSLEVKGLDAIDGTPVIDIKPYYPHYDKIDNARIPDWVDDLMKGYF